jgi:hypothetical protein
MSPSITPLALVELVALALHDLRSEVVFAGGAITGLLITDPAAPRVSTTKDVDVIISVTTRAEYLDGLGRRMRALGFCEDDEEDAPMCRWRMRDGIKLDLMPTRPEVLGFSNRWFPEAFEHARTHTLNESSTIKLITAPYFLATKLEAFGSRGNGDYMGSKDIEDICAVLHGREEIVAEVAESSAKLREYLAEHARRLLQDAAFEQSLAGHLPGEDLMVVRDRLAKIAGSGSALVG